MLALCALSYNRSEFRLRRFLPCGFSTAIAISIPFDRDLDYARTFEVNAKIFSRTLLTRARERRQWPPPPRVGFAFQIRSVNKNPNSATGIIAYGHTVQLSSFAASGLGTRQPCASRIFAAGSIAP